MSFEDNEHILELLPDFVVNALSDEETVRVARHLEVCDTCRAELRSLQQVADELPLALMQTVPPARVKTALMASIHEQKVGRSAAFQPAEQHKSSRLLRFVPAIGLVVLVVLGFINLVLWRQLYTVNHQASVPFQLVTLANTQNSPGAQGELVMNGDGQYGTLVVDKLASLGSNNQYQVWLVKGNERTSGGVFSVNPDGYASMEIYAPQPLNTYDSIGISVEPFGGSTAPTGAKVLGATIPR